MKSKYHIQITQQAFSDHFSQAALNTILKANVLQDRVINQMGCDFIHFDSNAFEAGLHYIQEQEDLIIFSIKSSDFITAQKALGRICHSWQDFYSHSNYVRLWVKREGQVTPNKINHDDPKIMHSPLLRSGINYGLIDFLALIPGLGKIITPLMPTDSHAKMNLDSPKSSHLFEYAYQAALKKTESYYWDLMNTLQSKHISEMKITRFRGQ